MWVSVSLFYEAPSSVMNRQFGNCSLKESLCCGKATMKTNMRVELEPTAHTYQRKGSSNVDTHKDPSFV